MEQISQREMRNRSGEVLRRVESGEAIIVSTNGHPAAMLVPVPESSYEKLVAAGRIVPATEDFDIADWQPVDLPGAEPTETLIADVRGGR